MAQDPSVLLEFLNGCPDCGDRRVALPPALPSIADDFDWRARDYDSFRLFLMEELAHRFPDRRRWTPADMEVVIVELLAAALDRMSHALDAISGEHYLETARRPESVRRLLALIGYDPARDIDPADLAAAPVPPGSPDWLRVESYWRIRPLAMEDARTLGPRRVREQQRMVTLADHQVRLSAHPLVTRAQANIAWSGAWTMLMASVLLADGVQLDAPLLPGLDPLIQDSILAYHRAEGLTLPRFNASLTGRRVLQILVEQFRMAGTEVVLADAREVPLFFWLAVRARTGYFRSELVAALNAVFDADNGGFFEPGHFDFGQAVYAADIIKAAMTVEGVETVCLNRFKRAGNGHPDMAGPGVIAMDPDEIAVCFNRPGQPDEGSFRITVDGGLAG
jgi:hypothetical protein